MPGASPTEPIPTPSTVKPNTLRKGAGAPVKDPADPWPVRIFPGLFGAFFGLALLKFGNPPILEKWVEHPANGYEFLLDSPWPIAWAYALLALISLAGLLAFALRRASPLAAPRWLVVLPLAWLAWQVAATFHSLSPELSGPTLKHFFACTACFYLGLFCLGRFERLGAFCAGIIAGFVLVLAVGWQQHFGGLEATRQFFFREIYPRLREVTPEYLKKMSSNRVFSTLFYPNALAGALLLFLPFILTAIAQARRRLTLSARGFLLAVVAVGAGGCLYWSGSKGGWLLVLLVGLLALLRLGFRRRLKIALVASVLALGLAGFGFIYASFFEKGATSVSARFDYWSAALRIAVAHPVAGTGPGTFMIPYREIKRPESEMTRMVHNDYLEQASDSGWLGCLAYTAFIVLGLGYSARTALAQARPRSGALAGGDWSLFSLWLGVFGWAAQSLLEFGLYLPALAWPAFAFLGFLLSRPRDGESPIHR